MGLNIFEAPWLPQGNFYPIQGFPLSGVGKCPVLRILNITFKYLLVMKYPQ